MTIIDGGLHLDRRGRTEGVWLHIGDHSFIMTPDEFAELYDVMHDLDCQLHRRSGQ